MSSEVESLKRLAAYSRVPVGDPEKKSQRQLGYCSECEDVYELDDIGYIYEHEYDVDELCCGSGKRPVTNAPVNCLCCGDRVYTSAYDDKMLKHLAGHFGRRFSCPGGGTDRFDAN